MLAEARARSMARSLIDGLVESGERRYVRRSDMRSDQLELRKQRHCLTVLSGGACGVGHISHLFFRFCILGHELPHMLAKWRC